MIVAVTHFKFKLDKLNELKNRWDPMLKEAQKEKGLIKGILLTSQDGAGLAMGFWDSFENAKAWGSTPTYRSFVNSLKDLMVGQPERHIYSLTRGELPEILEEKKAA